MTLCEALVLILSVYAGAISILCWRLDEKIYQMEQYVRAKRLGRIKAYDPDD